MVFYKKNLSFVYQIAIKLLVIENYTLLFLKTNCVLFFFPHLLRALCSPGLSSLLCSFVSHRPSPSSRGLLSSLKTVAVFASVKL